MIYDVLNPGPMLGRTGAKMYKCLDSVDTTDEWGTLQISGCTQIRTVV